MADYKFYIDKKVFVIVCLDGVDGEHELGYTGEVLDVDDETLTLNDKFDLRQIISLNKITHITEVRSLGNGK